MFRPFQAKRNGIDNLDSNTLKTKKKNILKTKKNTLKIIKNIKIPLILSLNPIKQINFKTYQLNLLPNSSFELISMRADLKSII